MRLDIERQHGALGYRPALQAGDRVLSLAEPPTGLDQHDLVRALKTLSFLGAVRMGTEDAFPMPDRIDVPDVGCDGRFAPYWYDRLVDEDVDPLRYLQANSVATFRKQLDAWLGSLIPGAEANVQNAVAFSQMNLQFRLSELGQWRRTSNVG